MPLEPIDFQTLVRLLQEHPLMQDAESRRELLRMAGLGKLLPLIDVSGAPFVATSKIVNFLAQYGRLTYENAALGLFLNTAAGMGFGKEQQEIVAGISVKYKLMEPTAPTPTVKSWQAPTSDAKVVEKIFGENTLRPIAFLARGTEVARSVVLISMITPTARGSGTGFLIAPNLVITNHHVVATAEQLTGVTVKANYQESFDGGALPTSLYKPKLGGIFHANPTLDYAVFEVEGDPGVEWGCLPLVARAVKAGERINIIQHPFGQPKQVTMQNNFVEYVGGDVLQYVTATNPGASGSPVCNDLWQVVGLHHAGGYIPEPTTGQHYNRNEGILVASILADLPAAIRTVVDSGLPAAAD